MKGRGQPGACPGARPGFLKCTPAHLAPRDGDAVIRPYEAGLKLWQAGFYVRFGGDCLQFGPTFNTRPEQLDSLFNAVGDVLNSLD